MHAQIAIFNKELKPQKVFCFNGSVMAVGTLAVDKKLTFFPNGTASTP